MGERAREVGRQEEVTGVGESVWQGERVIRYWETRLQVGEALSFNSGLRQDRRWARLLWEMAFYAQQLAARFLTGLVRAAHACVPDRVSD